MAAPRGRPAGYLAYVYRFDDDEGRCIYIGKGTGDRLKRQGKRFGREGYVVKWCRTETAAFNLEAKLIEKLQPVENKVSGGGGAVKRFGIKALTKEPWQTEMERIGTRKYIAKFLLSKDLTYVMSPFEAMRVWAMCFNVLN